MIKRAAKAPGGYQILYNDTARDRRLSFRARGVLAAILSRPDNWTVNAERLAAETDSAEGVGSVRTALRELEAAGYLVRRKVRGADGRYTWVQEVYDLAQSDGSVSAGGTISPSATYGSARDGKPSDGKATSIEVPRRTTEEENVLYSVTPKSRDDAETQSDETFEDWRSADRILFHELIGPTMEASETSSWTAGAYTADAWYTAFHKGTGLDQPMKWPGKWLKRADERGELDSWLSTMGLWAPTR